MIDIKELIKYRSIVQKIGTSSGGSGGSGSVVENMVWVSTTTHGSVVANGCVSNGIIRYVTFMNHDGTVEYGRKSVISGEDCADPVASGLMDTPTKENDAQYSYTFDGWATVANGGKDSNALKNVTEDRIVYANFISAVRYYTITYYDSDGVTVLKTESLAYGATPDYEPKKDGFVLGGWSPAISTVTGNASYTAQWRELNGIASVVTIPKTLMVSGTGTIGDVAINNAGTLLVAAIRTATTMPYACRIEDGVASVVDTSYTMTKITPNQCEFAYDDGFFCVGGYNSSLKDCLNTFSTQGTNITGVSESIGGAYQNLAASPVSNVWANSQHYSGSNYNLCCNGKSAIVKGGPKCLKFSPDGKYLAALFSTSVNTDAFLNIYNVSDMSLAKSLNGLAYPYKLSYNADGSLLAASFDTYPYVRVYETTNYTQIASLHNEVSSKSYPEFIGDNWLIVGSNTTVKGFLVTDDGIKTFADFNLDLPVYTGGTIEGIEKNHAGDRLMVWDSDNIEVWAKL
jgi:hypothetical protein